MDRWHRPSRTPVELNAYEREVIDEARGGYPLGRYMREAALARAAYELGRRGAPPGRHLAAIIAALRRR